MNYIVCFLLCFCNEEEAFEIFSYMLEGIVPDKFYQKTSRGTGLLGFSTEKYVLNSYVKDYLNLTTKDEQEAAVNFIETKSPQILLPLMVNTLQVEANYKLWNDLLEGGSFLVFEQAILVIILQCIKHITK